MGCDVKVVNLMLVVALVVDASEIAVTPGLVVGIVTETSPAGVVVTAGTAVVDLAIVVVVPANVGHSASMMPPCMTIPSRELELTFPTFEQALSTDSAAEFRAASHPAEHPAFPKSLVVHVGISESYCN